MAVSVEAASQLYQDAIRENVRKSSLRYLIQAGILVVAGLLAIIFPVISSEAIVIALGWLLLFSGIIQAVGLLASWRSPFAGLLIVSTVLALLIGFLILRNPTQSLVTISLLAIVFFMIEGISRVTWALTIRPMTGWIWVLASGVLGIILSLLLVATLETTATWLIALLVGIQLVSVGTSLGYVAYAVRKSTK